MNHNLPSRFSFAIFATVALFLITTAASILWMTRALDKQALQQSITQVEIARSNLLARVRLLTLDYSKWDAAYVAVRDADLDWLLDNIGSTAIIGQAVQLAVVWGGSLAADVGWNDDGTVEARSGLLNRSELSQAEQEIEFATPGEFDGAEFFAWKGDELYVMGVSHFEPVENAVNIPESEKFAGQLLLGVRVSDEVVADIAQSLTLAGADIVRHEPSDRPYVELRGPAEEPVGYFVWDRPRPGTTMLRRMLPLLFLLTAASAFMAIMNMRFLRRGAENLVAAEQKASHAARTDALTGLPNRAAFNELLASPARTGERAILFLDVDDFKRINDSIGHSAGDQVIICVAKRLASIIDASCLLARVGGDEFVFVLTGPDAEVRATSVAQEAARSIARPFSVLGHQMRLKMSMGYAVQADDSILGDDLVRQADLAMYEAKRREDGTPVAFSNLLEQAARDAAVIEQGLRKALDRSGEFSIAYQPVTNMQGGLVRAEALARWTSPELGVVPPDRFVAIAERSGLIVELGRRLIELICEDLVAHPDLNVSLNVSPLQLMAPEFIRGLVRSLETHGIDISRVEVELTESVVVDDPHLAAERLEELRSAGFSIALDDFGTGYSSMGYLTRLRFDTLKIDRSFVAKVMNSTKDLDVIDGMIRIAHGLNLKVVCEGVETAEELKMLGELGCDLAQGYHLGRPLPIAVLAERWLASAKGCQSDAA